MENSFKKTQAKGVVMLLLTAFIWGSSFVAQSVGMEDLGAFSFSAIRTSMGILALLPVVIYRLRKGLVKNVKKTVKSGVVIGFVFTAASLFQQEAFSYSTPGKIAFITAVYMFLVPIIGLFMGKRLPVLTWICVFVGFGGLFMLCIDPQNPGTINKGDLLAMVCSVGFAFHIILIDKAADAADGVLLSFTQFAVCAVISSILMLIFEEPKIENVKNAMVPLLYSGVFSCSVAYTLQIAGQKHTEPTVASLLMCMESVFAVLMAAVLLGQRLRTLEMLGCAVMFLAIILSQVSEALLEKKKSAIGVKPTAD